MQHMYILATTFEHFSLRCCVCGEGKTLQVSDASVNSWKAPSRATRQSDRQTLACVDKCLRRTLPRCVHIDNKTKGSSIPGACPSEDCRYICAGVQSKDVNQAEDISCNCPVHTTVCKTWTVSQCHARKLNSFHLCCLHKLQHLAARNTMMVRFLAKLACQAPLYCCKSPSCTGLDILQE